MPGRASGTAHDVAQKLVVIGGSAGALDPLREIVAGLPASFPAPVLVCLHLAAGARSRLPEILDAAGPLAARHPRHGERLEAGTILIAPPDHHLVVRDGDAHLSRGPRENRHRPAVDALFNSAARWHGPDVVGVVLSGALDDGVAGAAAIAAQDGVVVVQDPEEARVSTMPASAARAVRRARVAPARGIATVLGELVAEGAGGASNKSAPEPLLRWESENVDSLGVQHRSSIPGTPAPLGCPECHGGMFESRTAAEGSPHYVCHVGHSWSPETLVDAQRQASESSLYAAAAKLLEESVVLRRIAGLRREDGATDDAADLEARADRAERHAQQIQDMVRGTS
jgi:two-component system chemotaxis response regulator CheB